MFIVAASVKLCRDDPVVILRYLLSVYQKTMLGREGPVQCRESGSREEAEGRGTRELERRELIRYTALHMLKSSRLSRTGPCNQACDDCFLSASLAAAVIFLDSGLLRTQRPQVRRWMSVEHRHCASTSGLPACLFSVTSVCSNLTHSVVENMMLGQSRFN